MGQLPQQAKILVPADCRFLATLAAGLLLSLSSAAAQGGWQEAGSGAVAILPPPLDSTGITGGSLHCAEQRWNFLLRMEPAAAGIAGDEARLTIGGEEFPAKANRTGSGITVSVPPEALEALKAGSRVSITTGSGGEPAQATFPLGGSRKAIEAVAPRCSQVDMSAYERIAFSETSPGVEPAKALLAGEIKRFRSATGKSPAVAAMVLELDADRKLLFATLCGSTSYFGESGCSLTGYAAENSAAEWKEVYSTDGLLLHTDPKVAKDGWPDLLTLPTAGGTEASRWRWDGGAYAIPDGGAGNAKQRNDELPVPGLRTRTATWPQLGPKVVSREREAE